MYNTFAILLHCILTQLDFSLQQPTNREISRNMDWSHPNRAEIDQESNLKLNSSNLRIESHAMMGYDFESI